MSRQTYNNDFPVFIGCLKFLIVSSSIIEIFSFFSVVGKDGLQCETLFFDVLPCLTILLLIALTCFIIKILNREYKQKSEKLNREYKQKSEKLNREYTDKKTQLNRLVKSSKPFTNASSLVSDMETYIFDKEESYLRGKSHPAYTAAETVAELKKKTKEAISDFKQMLYKYEFLLSTFPELKKYVDDEEALQSLDDEDSYNALKDNYDYSRDYLSDEEWKSLTVDERNQLALDRYKKRPKSNWTVGMFYEMYIGYLLRSTMYVIQFGIINGLDDLGRDIIAKTRLDDGTIGIYIIQCKNWSVSKEVHENVVCQIFGSAMEYKVKNDCESKGQLVVPVLCTTTRLSDTAKIFADRLGVEVFVKPMGDFPMVKCNINNGKKIYHLPFDQQYWKTKIEKDGEFYAWTVKEATEKGFRRAFRHIAT